MYTVHFNKQNSKMCAFNASEIVQSSTEKMLRLSVIKIVCWNINLNHYCVTGNIHATSIKRIAQVEVRQINVAVCHQTSAEFNAAEGQYGS